MNIGITATREGLTGPQLTTIRRMLLPYTIHSDAVNTVHQGCCVGGDEQITILAFALGFRICAHQPVDRRYYFSKLAYELSNYKCSELPYLDRNQEIVDHSDMLIGAPKEKSEVLRSGTWATIRRAREGKGIHTVVVYTDGGFDEYNSHS